MGRQTTKKHHVCGAFLIDSVWVARQGRSWLRHVNLNVKTLQLMEGFYVAPHHEWVQNRKLEGVAARF
jgi:hypothetical protein